MDSRRVSHLIYGMLLQQQSTLARMERSGTMISNVIDMTVINQNGAQLISPLAQTQVLELKPSGKQPAHLVSKRTKLVPWTTRFDRWGVSGQLIVLPKENATSYRATVHASLLGKTYSIQVRVAFPDLSFDRMLHVRNIVPNDCAMTLACKAGDFNHARKLLENGLARGSDVTPGGWPMLDVGEISV
jgi:hypothetical protein